MVKAAIVIQSARLLAAVHYRIVVSTAYGTGSTYTLAGKTVSQVSSCTLCNFASMPLTVFALQRMTAAAHVWFNCLGCIVPCTSRAMTDDRHPLHSFSQE
jgi:hypothetical protein